MCAYEGLGISIMSFPILDGLFVYVCMREWNCYSVAGWYGPRHNLCIATIVAGLR